VYYSGSKTVSYPASKSGGTLTVSYSGTANEDVEVRVDVNTVPFDNSVSTCNNHVNVLTGSVEAMNAAQCLAVTKNADTVSKTIINGFFQTVRTDLGTQKVELQQAVESRLLLLRQQAQMLQAKRQTMETDYARTSARYQKIFEELNKELAVRVHETDQPIFTTVEAIDSQNDRMVHTDMVQNAVTLSKESSQLQAQIAAATVKRHALEAMNRAQDFLASKAETEHTIHETITEGSGEDRYFIPVCYIRTESEHQAVDQKCYVAEYHAHDESLNRGLCKQLADYEFAALSEAENEQVKSYVQTAMDAAIPGDDSHSKRVRAMINKMLNRK
jgi:hypothetical protein